MQISQLLLAISSQHESLQILIGLPNLAGFLQGKGVRHIYHILQETYK